MKSWFLVRLTYWVTFWFQGYPAQYALVMDMVMRMFPAPPGPPTAVLVSEENGMLNYQVAPPPDTAPDVASYEYTVAVAGQTPDQVLTQKKGDPGPTFSVNTDGSHVSLTVVEIDDAGNRSDPSDAFEFDAKDTIPPPKPGAPSATLVSET